ncbi:phosphatase PAP2 family protein [Vibrio sp. DBSS07]|uniref:undecaprenyl-diphosphate phosphatase n=2 Tax=Vibrio paucivorans TaxID=2829489 RepID=A0A9X3CHF0_9VIBR|nr:phosphatase PAP2 family protein [Vibrio paucivorans]
MALYAIYAHPFAVGDSTMFKAFCYNPLITIPLLCLSSSAVASDSWKTVSDIGAYGLVATALAVPAYKEDWQGFKQAGFSIATASGVGLLGKATIEKERPDGSDNHSFPSNHTANAFASATTLHLRYGWQAALPAYGMATLVGVGRVEADKHYWSDVLAGAVIGSVSAWVFTDAFDDNVQVLPWVDSQSVGLNVSMQW